MKTFRKGGIHPDPHKLTAGMAVRDVGLPDEFRIMLAQSIGAPAKCIVKPGQMLRRCEMIAEAGGFVSAPVHTPVAAKVKKIEQTRNWRGLWQEAVVLERLSPEEIAANPGIDDWPEPRTQDETDALAPAEIISIVGDSGIVGLGGATFPTRVKLSVPEGKKAEWIIINAAECEPYLTCDDQLMRACPSEIIRGIELLMRAVSAPRAVIGIEANKPEAMRRMAEAAALAKSEISIVPLRTRYPQGGEKQLIEALTGRRVPPGGLPIDVGAVVDNVATAYAVYEAVCLRRPLTRRVVTVTGLSVTDPGNFMVNIGTPLSALAAAVGGFPADTAKVIAGGPMMGQAISQTDAPSTKGLSGLLMMSDAMSRRPAEHACIRCARCVSACPMGLQPYLLMTLAKMRLAPEVKDEGVMNCLECGCCAYICPSGRPLVDYIRLGKQLARPLLTAR